MTDRKDPQLLRDRIVDTAIDLAEQEGWEELRLRKVAERCGVPLTDVLSEFRDIDAVANAWFERALAAMLQPPEPGFQGRPASERVHTVMMRWFEATAAHQRLTGEMIRTKLYTSHPHHWVPMVFSLSRLIHWVREAAMLDAGGRQRQAEEIGLTLVFLRTLREWLRDATPAHQHTRRYLACRLVWLDCLTREGRSITAPATFDRRSRPPAPQVDPLARLSGAASEEPV
jgi:AcrR family transcriptional regulator